MEEVIQNVFGYIDELDDEDLRNLKEQLMNDIEYLKQTKDNKNQLSFELDRLKYVKKLMEERKIEDIKKI